MKVRIKTHTCQRFVFCAILICSVIFIMDTAKGEFLMIKLKAGRHIIKSEVAATIEERDIGLMNRRSLSADHGMLFVFPEARRHCMWMRDTHIPLSAAFLDDSGTIVDLLDMPPDTEDLYCASRPVRFVLEMEQGWFRRKDVTVGSHISGFKKAPLGR